MINMSTSGTNQSFFTAALPFCAKMRISSSAAADKSPNNEVKDAVSTHTDIDWVSCAVGFVVAAFVGLCAIKLVNWLVKTDKFKVFAYYTLVLGVIVLVISFIEMCMGHPISFAK